MKSKTVETTPFQHKYYLVDRFQKHRYGPFNSIEEADSFTIERANPYWHCYRHAYSCVLKLSLDEVNAYSLVKSLYGTVRHKYYKFTNYPAFCIVDEFGDVVHPDTIKSVREATYKPYEWHPRRRWSTLDRLVKKKNDGLKIKRNYVHYEYVSSYDGEVGYSVKALGYTRAIRTTAERRANAGCDADYGKGLVRGRRSFRQLPNRWDDPRIAAYDVMASWKHHSKRRKQWKPK